MRIVIGTDTFYPYFERGGEVHTFNVARHLVRFGHEVTVLCAKTSSYSNQQDASLPDYEEVEGIRIIRSKKPFKFGATLSSLPSLFERYSYLKQMIAKVQVDIVNVVTYRPRLPFLMAARGKVPCTATIPIVSLDGFLGFKAWKHFEAGKLGAIAGCLIENISLRFHYDGIMTTSDFIAEQMQRFALADKIKPIYAGVDLQQIDSVAPGPKSPRQIAFVGSLDRRKNVLDAIEATNLARKEMGDLRLMIISQGGEYEPVIEKTCNQDEAFKYWRRVSRDQIMKILKESSLLILPSLDEGGPVIVLLEAMACGTPFIAYDIPPVRETQQKTQGGVLVPTNCKAMSQKICELLTDESQLQILAKKGRQQVEEEFTWEKTARREEEALEGFLNAFHQ